MTRKLMPSIFMDWEIPLEFPVHIKLATLERCTARGEEVVATQPARAQRLRQGEIFFITGDHCFYEDFFLVITNHHFKGEKENEFKCNDKHNCKTKNPYKNNCPNRNVIRNRIRINAF